MIVAEAGTGWQLFVVLLILSVPGYLLTPVVQRLLRAGPRAARV